MGCGRTSNDLRHVFFCLMVVTALAMAGSEILARCFVRRPGGATSNGSVTNPFKFSSLNLVFLLILAIRILIVMIFFDVSVYGAWESNDISLMMVVALVCLLATNPGARAHAAARSLVIGRPGVLCNVPPLFLFRTLACIV